MKKKTMREEGTPFEIISLEKCDAAYLVATIERLRRINEIYSARLEVMEKFFEFGGRINPPRNDCYGSQTESTLDKLLSELGEKLK